MDANTAKISGALRQEELQSERNRLPIRTTFSFPYFLAWAEAFRRASWLFPVRDGLVCRTYSLR